MWTEAEHGYLGFAQARNQDGWDRDRSDGSHRPRSSGRHRVHAHRACVGWRGTALLPPETAPSTREMSTKMNLPVSATLALLLAATTGCNSPSATPVENAARSSSSTVP